MGYKKILTYTLKNESQSTMKALRAVKESDVPAQDWNRPNRKRISQSVYTQEKIRWSI